MAKTNAPVQGEHVDIPKISPIAARVSVNAPPGIPGAIRSGFVFIAAVAVPVLPAILLYMLLNQKDTGPAGLTWVWLTVGGIVEVLAFMAAYGIVRSLLEADA
jgi:hypothetical protein